jgi:hypothetical protein
MGFKDIWQKIKSSPSVNYPHFKIAPKNILDENEKLQGDFEAEKHYFEIRIVSQFLKDKREYWSNYNPLSVVLTEFSFAGSKQALPFVVGPKILAKLEQVKDSHEVRYINTRVAGPTPYIGDQVALFTGLFRMRTANWAVQALDLLQSVATTFDASKLTKYIDISTPLMQGIEGFLGMEDMELRLAHRIEYTDASVANVNKFQPGYWVMIRSDKALDQAMLKVKDNVLMIADKQGELEEFTACDYVIYSVEKLERRRDYTEFEFHKILKDIKRAIWDGNGKKSKDLFHSLFYSIGVNDDLTPIQQNELQLFYKKLVKKEIEKYKAQQQEDSMFDFGDGADTFESGSKYAIAIRKIDNDIQTELSLDDIIDAEDEDMVNDHINTFLKQESFKTVDLSRFNSRTLAGKLYEDILKL